MTLTLHRGVYDVPYVEEESATASRKRIAAARKGKQKPRGTKAPGTVTTADVADILEAHYALFTVYFETHETQIAEWFAESMSNTIDSLIAGAPPTIDPYGEAIQKVIAGFRTFIESREAETRGIPGVPTKAALQGVNHRLKRKRGERRPSFRDTGLMESAFVAWIEGN